MASKRMMIIAVLVAAVVVVAAAAVALNGGSKQAEGTDALITDAMDRSITTNDTPMRIVSCAPTITEMVYTLGAGSKLVAVTKYCDYPAEVVSRKDNGTLANVGYYATPNFDVIVQAQPDLVILVKDASGHPALAAKLDEAHIKNVVIFACTNVTEIYTNILMMGKLLHNRTGAEGIVASMQPKVQYIQSHVGVQASKPSVMFAVYIYTNGKFSVACNGTYIDDAIRIAGGNNAFSSQTSFNTFGNEEVMTANPDVIFLTATMSTSTDRNATQIRDSILDNPMLRDSNAVKNGHVYIFIHESENIFLRFSMRIVDGASLMARMLYPDSFGGAIPNIIDGPYQSYLPSYNSG